MERLKNPKLLTTELLSLKEMVCSALKFLALSKIGNALAVNIKE
jgi:hypothetical protein